MNPKIPRHLVWSTDRLDLRDPFQKRWLLRQTLMYGTAQDIGALKLGEIEKNLDRLDLPKEVESLWRRYLEYANVEAA